MHTNVRLLKVKITAVNSYPLGRMDITTIQHGSPFNNRTRNTFSLCDTLTQVIILRLIDKSLRKIVYKLSQQP